MNIQQAKEEIKNTVKAYLTKNAYGEYQITNINQRPLLLIGPPGIGKTQIMAQIAKECKIGLVSYTITHHTRQSAVGLPYIKEEEFEGKTYSITEYTMSEIIASIYQKMKETGLKEGILFIDEINCVSETLAPTMLQFLQNKTFGNQKVPEGWIIVAAGNPPEYNKSVREFDMVTLDRVRYINVEANYHIWKEYALSKHLHPMILGYLELKPSQFYRIETSIDGMEFVTARGWEDLSHLITLYEKLNLDINKETIYQYLHHEEVAEDVEAYYLLYKKYQDNYGIMDILDGKVNTKTYQRLAMADFDERVSVVNLLLDGLFKLFDQYTLEKYYTDTWYAFLKEYRNNIDTISYQDLLNQKLVLFEQNKKADILTKDQLHHQRYLFEQLSKVNIPTGLSSLEAFNIAKEPFDRQREILETAETKALNSINHALQFMEDAFSKGQEMVIFITNLSLSSNAALFLSEHEIPVYENHKQALLIGTRKAEILDDLTH
ncbi:ATP-binding protein [Faecalitalea cylindroides]|uniref:ATP-binding protein n=1 Tax=Faecalitalea cylindroides TaxID=39483 RepID=UPI000B38F78B|nr:AAA family ATPase [Faecalitalea cylindroides]OUN61116.1 ATPase [Faecalitalea cylindroides]